MAIERPAFTPTRLDEERAKDKGKVFSVWLNNAEVEALNHYGELLQQEKPSTIIKQLAELGAILIDDDLTGRVCRLVLKNIQKNKRLGIDYAEGFRRKSNRNAEES